MPLLIPAPARLFGSALFLTAVGVHAKITADCRNTLDAQFRYDGSKKLKNAVQNLQGLSFYPKTAKTSVYTPAFAGATPQDFPRWLPACSSGYPFVGGTSQLVNGQTGGSKQCKKNPAPTDGSSEFTDPVQPVFPFLKGSDPETFGCCDQGSQETGIFREVAKSPNARHQRRWEYYSLKALNTACQDNEASSSYGTLYLMSAMAKKTAAGVTYKQAFDHANVICIPQQCDGFQLVELMEERAKECAKNFMDQCWYGLSPVKFKNSFEQTQLLSTTSSVSSKDNWLAKVYSEDFGYEIFTSGFDPESDSRLGGEGTVAKEHTAAYPVIGSS
eukprot:g2619.t1